MFRRIRIVLITFLTMFLMLSVACYVFIFYGNLNLPEYNQIVESYKKSEAVLKDRYGRPIHTLRVDYLSRRLEWTELKDISPSLIKAVIYSEDKRFYTHRGIDMIAFMGASLENIISGGRRGASTITMQLVSKIDQTLKPRIKKRSFSQKINQMRKAIAIEKRWTKDQILEAYLNLVSFRGELQGIEAASRGIFMKVPWGIDLEESLILASLIRSPNAEVKDITRRVIALNKKMNAGISAERLANKTSEALSKPYRIANDVVMAPHIARYLLKGDVGDVRCSLDRDIQGFVLGVLREHILRLRHQNVTDGAAIVVDNRTGDILAYVGNTGAESTAFYVDGVRAKRQAGSTLKPFLYSLAFDMMLITPVSELLDEPINITTESGVYRPENYDRDYKGYVTARVALASSLNIPAVRVLMLTGEDMFVEKLNELGFEDLKDGEFYGYALALGTLDVSLYELVNAFRTLANGGVFGELNLIYGNKNKPKRRVFSRQATYLVSHILSDRTARSITFHMENPLATRFWSAVKTGTSKDMRDNWCIGYTDRHTVGVWVGNFSGESMWNVSGVTGAAPIWNDIVRYLHRNVTSKPQEPPDGIIKVQVDNINRDGLISEWFIKGTEPFREIRTIAEVAIPKIIYPCNDMVIAIDPDIPADNQKVFFERTGAGKDIKWVINDEVLGYNKRFMWTPEGGKHKLRLVNQNNEILHEVSFIVSPQ